jgi:regulator of protease activity HflC (stomatin/prohibitin superfamily)
MRHYTSEERKMMMEEKANRVVRRIKRGVIIGVGLIVGAVIWLNITENISQGHVGVVFNKAKGGVQEHPLDEGFTFVSPLSKITEYPVSLETVKYKFSLPTADTKTIDIPLSFDYHNEIAKTPYIYREWRGQKPEALEDGYLRRNILSIASEVVSKYTILELNANRGKIQAEILKEFSKKVGKKGFIVSGVNLGTPVYDEQTKQAIQQVVNKQQELKAMELDKAKAKLEAEKKKIEAEGNAQKKLVEAKATADATKIEANAQAEANKKIQSTLSKEVLQKMQIEKWNGVNSTHILGNGTGVNINTK